MRLHAQLRPLAPQPRAEGSSPFPSLPPSRGWIQSNARSYLSPPQTVESLSREERRCDLSPLDAPPPGVGRLTRGARRPRRSRSRKSSSFFARYCGVRTSRWSQCGSRGCALGAIYHPRPPPPARRNPPPPPASRPAPTPRVPSRQDQNPADRWSRLGHRAELNRGGPDEPPPAGAPAPPAAPGAALALPRGARGAGSAGAAQGGARRCEGARGGRGGGEKPGRAQGGAPGA